MFLNITLRQVQGVRKFIEKLTINEIKSTMKINHFKVVTIKIKHLLNHLHCVKVHWMYKSSRLFQKGKLNNEKEELGKLNKLWIMYSYCVNVIM